MSPTLIVAGVAGVAVVAAAGMGWLLLEAHQDLGKAELKAQINANTVSVLQDQEERNQVIDQKLDRLASARDIETREIVREIYIQPSSDACRKSAAMRALDGKLQYRPGAVDGRPPAAAAPPQLLQAPGR